MRRSLPLAAAAAVAAAPLGYRVGVLPLNAALLLLLAGVVASLAALVWRVVATARRRGPQVGRGWAAAAVLLPAGVLAVPVATLLSGVGAPPIHDVTTDLDDPPRFDAVAPLRAGAPNMLEHGGPQLAAAQRAAYPDLVPLDVGSPAPDVLETARAVAAEMGWEIVAVDPTQGLLEATATTFWFGFRDDIAVRVRPSAGGGAVVDVRSVSRVGVGDLGANATRIRTFLARLRAALSG